MGKVMRGASDARENIGWSKNVEGAGRRDPVYVQVPWCVASTPDLDPSPLEMYKGGGLAPGTQSGLALCGGPSLTAPCLTHNYYHADGNGNITALETTNETLSASYR